MLYTRYKGKVRDSIMFYKHEIDKDGEVYIDQRLETISFLKSDLTLYNLVSFTGLSEVAFQPEIWNKYKINITTGKIDLVKKLNSRDNEEDEEKEEPKKEEYKSEKETVEEDIEDLPFNNMSFLYDCKKSDYVYFSLSKEGIFSCPSTGLRFNGLLKK